jgi:hypothetical protein
MHKITVIGLRFPLDVLHVSDYLKEQLYNLYIAYTGIYQMRCTAYKRFLLNMNQ